MQRDSRTMPPPDHVAVTTLALVDQFASNDRNGWKADIIFAVKTERRCAGLSIGWCPLSGLNIPSDEALSQAHRRPDRDCHREVADNGQRHGEEQQEPVCGTRTEMLAPTVRLAH